MQEVQPALNKAKVRAEGAHSKKSSATAHLLEPGCPSEPHRAITPPSHTDCGAQISRQCPPAAMQASAALPTSTASSCQPSGSAGAPGPPRQQSGAASSCARAQKGAGAADAQSPPTSNKGSGRRRAASASAAAGRKRVVTEDPLQKAIARYMEAKVKKAESGEGTPPSSQPLRASKRPRTATGLKGAAKSGTTTSGTSGSAFSAGAAPSIMQPPPAATTLAQGMTSLALASPVKKEAGLGTTAGAQGARAGASAAAGGAAGGGGGDPRLEGMAAEELTGAVRVVVAAEGAEAAAAVFAPLATLQQHYSTLQEQLDAGVGPELGACLAEALALGQGNPWGVLPSPVAPLTEEELAEARRQLKATAKPFPPDYKWVSPMPLSEEAWGPLLAPGSAGTGGARAGGSSSGVSGAAGAAAGKSTSKSGKAGVAPYRLPVPLQPGTGSAAATGVRKGGGAAGGAGRSGRGRYTLRAERGKRKKDSGYVSFDSDECTSEEEYEELGDEDEEMEVRTDADPSDSELDASQPSATSGAARPTGRALPIAAVAAAAQQQQPRQRRGAAAACAALSGAKQSRSGLAAAAAVKQKPPSIAGAPPAPTAGPMAAAAAVGAGAFPAKPRKTISLPAMGTPKVPTLAASNVLSPLLSPTLATLLFTDQCLPGSATVGQTLDLNIDLDHFMGDLDFSNDAVIASALPAHSAPALPGGSGMQAAMEVAAAFSGTAKGAAPLSAPTVTGTPGEGWLAAAGLAAAANLAASASASGGGQLLNPPLPTPRAAVAAAASAVAKTAALAAAPLPAAAAVIRAASAPVLPLSNSLGMAPASATSRPTSAGPHYPPGPAMHGDTCAPAGAALAEEAEADGLDALVADPQKERLDLLHALGGGLGAGLGVAPAGRRTPSLGSPLLQGLMSPSALGALLDGW